LTPTLRQINAGGDHFITNFAMSNPPGGSGRTAEPEFMTQCQNIVLVVDGDLAVRESLKFALQIEGLAVFVFANGSELLAHPMLRMARCLVLDHKLPLTDGFAVLARLAAEKVLVPVILMTAHATDSLCRRAAAAGVRRVVEKPLLDGALVDTIHDILAAHQSVTRSE
jgi:FixJ family two-component response regulator